MIFHIEAAERRYFPVYPTGIAERIHDVVFVETTDESWWILWITLAKIAEANPMDAWLMDTMQRKAIELAIALNQSFRT